MEENKKSRPPFYGVVQNEDGTEINYGTFITDGKCEYTGEHNHWNFKKDKIYEYAHVMKAENLYVYAIFGEDTCIETTPEHFMFYFNQI